MMKTKRFTPNDSWFIWQGRIRPDCEYGQQDAPRLTASPSRNTNSKSEKGIALVITLILLSVTLVMAVAFLAVSRRERGSVTTTQDTATAKFAADAALAKAEARIVSQILTTTNPYVFSLYVSTNYINRLGFTNTGTGVTDLKNVNYDYYYNGSGPLSAADLAQNIANLYYDPRPPVFYSNDFRFYLDLNRNGKYDTNGWVEDVNNSGQPILNAAGGTNYSLEVGDPEWIGILEHPDQPHGPNNPFIARYCFIAVPANSLDLNYIHNQTFSASLAGNNLSIANDGYFRNQGVGNWEMNLAAFLADLNTNIWDPQLGGNSYQYLQPNSPNVGVAFNDAFDLLTNRYANFYPSQPSAQSLFGINGVNAFEYNGIDAYTRGPLQTTFDTSYSPQTFYNYNWVGAENTNNFFTPDDLFNTNKTANFGIHLQHAGVNLADANGNIGSPQTVSTYDRYTFYRMLAQLGTDTQPASGKVNLNYQNALVNYDINGVATGITIVPNYETNFISWNPRDFFTVAANQLLKMYTTEWYESGFYGPSNYLQSYYGLVTNYSNLTGYGLTNYPYLGLTNQIPSFGITNIPVLVNGSYVYTPAVNRLLQLAANIYDASTNTSVANVASNYPSVFRPIFWKTNEYNSVVRQFFTNIYIKGFQYVQEQPGLVGSVVWPPLPAVSGSSFVGTTFATPVELTDLPFGISVTNVWGVPWIVGAKKGLPNFNGFELDNTFFVERELQFNRNNNAPGPSGSTFPYGRNYTTNQMYLIGVSNTFAMDDWNSYGNQYNNNINVYAQNFLSVALTNSDNFAVQNLFATNVGFPFANWPGQLFVMPFGTNITVMQNLSFAPSPPSTNGLYLYYASPNPVTFSGITFRGPCFIPSSLDPSNYLDSGTPPLPQFGLMATNHLQAFLLDTDRNGNNHILDYVQLGSMNSTLNVNAAIADPDSDISVNGDNGGLWSTNYYTGTATPYGIIEQYLVSSGSPFPAGEDGDEASASGKTGWTTAPVPGLGNLNSVAAQQAYFEAFFTAGNIAYDNADGLPVTNLSLSVQAPFTPMRAIIQRYVYQANDPLVHYLSSDLNDIADDTSNKVNIATIQTNSIKTIGILSDRYMPWGNYTPGENPAGGPPTVNQLKPANINFGYPIAQSVLLDQNQYNFSYRDPLVWSSDNWDFPTAKYPTVGWLGRVHRGTPWQSVYLKSTNIWSLSGTANGLVNQGPATWEIWTGDLNANDAFNEIPAQDRLLFDIFTAAPDDDAMRGQLSVNIGADDPTDMLAGLASWSALLSGTVVFATNNVNDQVLGYTPGYQSPTPVWQENAPYFTVMTNQPLGVPLYPITESPMWQIVQGINSTRTNFTTLDGLQGVFEHAGDVLATPELSDASPYLASGDQNQLQYGVNDEMYEWLPQQIMGLVTASGTPQNPPRYVVYCYGQTLKPAPNGLVSSGSFFGMCTNYQVTAESAARVVIEVQNSPTPANPNATPHVVVEQYNPLPPD